MTILDFVEEFKELYPEFAEEIESYEGKIKQQAGVVKDAINEAGTDGTLDIVAEILSFIGEMIKNADDEIKNILAVSILEHLDIEREQIDKMPEMVRELYKEISEYNAE